VQPNQIRAVKAFGEHCCRTTKLVFADTRFEFLAFLTYFSKSLAPCGTLSSSFNGDGHSSKCALTLAGLTAICIARRIHSKLSAEAVPLL